jgi:4'-phosphopantetheinyl transferase
MNYIDITMEAAPPPSSPPWAPGPLRPLLRESVVDVWRADLGAVADDLHEGLLSSDERARASRMVGEGARMLWCRSRGLLRVLLARYLNDNPATLRFSTSARGKLFLAGERHANPLGGPKPRSTAPIQFNLSHSADVAVYAFAAAAAVGVDIELDRRDVNEVAIAARTFGPCEAARLRELDAETRRREFLRAWVRYEAQVKCVGVGIAGARAIGAANEPWMAELEVGPPGAAAVAVEAAPRELCCWDWVA